MIPVGVHSLTLDPNPADGSKNQVVKGTVTLARAAPVRTTVTLYADNANATLPVPLGDGVSEGSVTIPEDDKSATFSLNTNDNDLPKGATSTVDITAFYTEPTTAQLNVRGAP